MTISKKRKRFLRKRYGKIGIPIFTAFKEQRDKIEIAITGNRRPSVNELLEFTDEWIRQWKEEIERLKRIVDESIATKTFHLCEELVRRSFPPLEIITERVSPQVIEMIARHINKKLGKMKKYLNNIMEAKKSPEIKSELSNSDDYQI